MEQNKYLSDNHILEGLPLLVFFSLTDYSEDSGCIVPSSPRLILETVKSLLIRATFCKNISCSVSINLSFIFYRFFTKSDKSLKGSIWILMLLICSNDLLGVFPIDLFTIFLGLPFFLTSSSSLKC